MGGVAVVGLEADVDDLVAADHRGGQGEAGLAVGGQHPDREAASGGDVLLEASLPVKAGTIYSVAAIGGAGKDVRLLPIVDATAMGQMPSGGVATGAGGTAPGPSVPGLTVVLAGMAVLVAACIPVGALLRRRAG